MTTMHINTKNVSEMQTVGNLFTTLAEMGERVDPVFFSDIIAYVGNYKHVFEAHSLMLVDNVIINRMGEELEFGHNRDGMRLAVRTVSPCPWWHNIKNERKVIVMKFFVDHIDIFRYTADEFIAYYENGGNVVAREQVKEMA